MREQNQNEKEAGLGDNSDAQNKNIVMAGLSGLVDNIFKNVVKDVSDMDLSDCANCGFREMNELISTSNNTEETDVKTPCEGLKKLILLTITTRTQSFTGGRWVGWKP